MAEWNIETYRQNRLVFYGSVHCPLPRQLFTLFEKCRTRYEKHPDYYKRFSHSSLTFSEERTEAVQKRWGESPRVLNPRNTVMWISLFPGNGPEETRWLAIGMGLIEEEKTHTGMEGLNAVNQLVIKADRYLSDSVYRRVRVFAEQNPLRYLRKYAYTDRAISEDMKALERRFDCTWCERQETCPFLDCPERRNQAYKAFAEHRLDPEGNAVLAAAWQQCFPVAVLDMEWEGGHPTQFAGLLLNPGLNGLEVADRLEMYIKLPKGMHVSPVVRGLTQISDELLRREGVPLAEALERISGFLSRAAVICGQGVRSDLDVLIRAYEEEGKELPPVILRDEVIDTTFLVQDMNGLEQAMSLKEEAQLTGVVHWKERFHDARTDTLLAARLLAVYLPGFILRYRLAPIMPLALMRRPEAANLLADFDGTPKHKEQKKKRRR